MALVTKQVIEEKQGNAVFVIHFAVKALTSCTLLTRQNASVLKVAMPCTLRSKAYKQEHYGKNSSLIHFVPLLCVQSHVCVP